MTFFRTGLSWYPDLTLVGREESEDRTAQAFDPNAILSRLGLTMLASTDAADASSSKRTMLKSLSSKSSFRLDFSWVMLAK